MAVAISRASVKKSPGWDPVGWEASVWRNKRDWQNWELVGLKPSYTLDDLVLNWVDKRVVDLDIKGAITGIHVTRSIEQASNVQITVRDPKQRIFNIAKGRVRKKVLPQGGINRKTMEGVIDIDEAWEPILPPTMIGRAAEVAIDDVEFRLVGVNYTYSTAETVLTFEDRTVYWLRRKKGIERKASRNDVTRFEFCLALIREIKSWTVPVVCPQLHVKQPIAKTQEPDNKVTLKEGTGRAGFQGHDLKIKGKTAQADQIRNADQVLTRASQADGADKRSVTACMAACIVESQVRNLRKGDRDSLGILQVRVSTSGNSQRSLDIDWCVDKFMNDGFWGKGGAVDVAKKHPSETIGWVAQQVQGSGNPGAYDKYLDEAEAFVSAWQGGSLPESSGGTYRTSYQYARDKDEDSWTCIQRLMDEVACRCFMVGKAAYLLSEEDLYRRRVRYRVTPDDPAISELQYDVDWGKPVSEATFTVALDQWGAPPGSVVELDGFIIPDGRWIVSQIDRDWFSPFADVTIKTPGPAKKEPATTLQTRNQSQTDPWIDVDADSKSGKLYLECQRISDNASSYVYGGSHGKPLSQVASNDHMDCSSSCSLALYRAGMFNGQTAITSGEFAASWGQPGKGKHFTVWANGGHVWIEFHGIGEAVRFDTSAHGDGKSGDGPHLRKTARSDQANFTARHWPGA
jgi:hypothetical protein